MAKTLPTWGGRSEFTYEGSVAEGTLIRFGRTGRVPVTRAQYADLLEHFLGRTVQIGTSRTSPPKGSVGAWLQANVTRTATASYVGAILVHEGYAQRLGGRGTELRFLRKLG